MANTSTAIFDLSGAILTGSSNHASFMDGLQTILSTLVGDALWFVAGYVVLRLGFMTGAVPEKWRPAWGAKQMKQAMTTTIVTTRSLTPSGSASRSRPAVSAPKPAAVGTGAAHAGASAAWAQQVASPEMTQAAKAISLAAERGDVEQVGLAWTFAGKVLEREVLPQPTLRAVSRAVTETSDGDACRVNGLLKQIGQHLGQHAKTPGGASALHATLDTISRCAGFPSLAVDVLEASGMGPPHGDMKGLEIIVGAFAALGNEAAVKDIFQRFCEGGAQAPSLCASPKPSPKSPTTMPLASPMSAVAAAALRGLVRGNAATGSQSIFAGVGAGAATASARLAADPGALARMLRILGEVLASISDKTVEVGEEVKSLSSSCTLPAKAVAEVLQAASGLGSSAVLDCLTALEDIGSAMPHESSAVLFTWCTQSEDTAVAAQMERMMQLSGGLSFSAYDALLKLYAKVDEVRAARLFKEMLADGYVASEGLCGSLISRCGENKHVAFAELVADYLRGRSMMTLAIFKTLMKVYAGCGLYDKACNLYEELIQTGIKPDSIMHSCAVKFAVKAGRRALSEDLFKTAPEVDVHNYMCLIRAAGREGQVDRALELFDSLRRQRPELLDSTVYNCVLDACLVNGAKAQADSIIEAMEAAGVRNCVTYNTLIKGHLASGDYAAAKQSFSELCSSGLSPDSASFNGFLSAAVSAGDLPQVWKLIAEMDRQGVPLDHYSISILMKAARKTTTATEASRLLSVLDRPHVRVTEDEILLNTALDACACRRDTKRLGKILQEVAASKIRPTVQTYGLLIRAKSALRDVHGCMDLWRQMVGERGLTPNNVTLSCMLDALVTAGCTTEAAEMYEEWSAHVLPNTILCSTMLKGFANSGESERAMSLFRDMQARGVRVNHVAYTTLIDAQARAGNTQQAEDLLRLMEKDGCQPNTITYSALLKGHCVKGDLDKALTVFEAMLSRGLKADTVAINTLLDGCVRHSRFELADQLIDELPRYKIEASPVTISILVKMWGKRRNLDESFAVVHNHIEAGRNQRLDAKVGNCLISACFHNRCPERALDVLQEMKACPCWDGPDAGTYEALIPHLANSGLCEEAVQVLEEASQQLARESNLAKRNIPEGALQTLRTAIRRRGLTAELGDRVNVAAALFEGHSFVGQGRRATASFR